MTLLSLVRIALRIGPLRLPGILFQKCMKRARYARMIGAHADSSIPARWNGSLPAGLTPNRFRLDLEGIIAKADGMLHDENTFFTFRYHLRGIERRWEFDPLEKKYWPRRHYTEKQLHSADTPRDVKIVWEINRFTDLPTLGQAFALSGEAKYADEAVRRMLSWIDGNPFASTINWASALEISIRLISWTVTVALLHQSSGAYSVPAADETKIGRSIYEQARYLAADLSTDKVVPTNHLIGEAAGLFVIASLWKFPNCKRYAERANGILTREMLRETFDDGVTREATSWYHQFVTDFCDLADRVGAATGNTFDERFRARLADMKSFLETMTVEGNLVRYGDADDGWALWLEGDREEWKRALFGPPPTVASKPSPQFYTTAQLVASHVQDSFIFLRAGKFGMGGAGFASHAHDDLLSPILYLAGEPVLADPGTFVYNGNPESRKQFRLAEAHNGIVIGDGSGAEPRRNFGWNSVRCDAKILEATFDEREATVSAQYGEWAAHRRVIKLNENLALIVDRFDRPARGYCTWHWHLDPQWNLSSGRENLYSFRNSGGKILALKLLGDFDEVQALPYEYSPSYGVKIPATMLRCSARNPSGVYAVLFTLELAT